jgi:hypothetical protein
MTTSLSILSVVLSIAVGLFSGLCIKPWPVGLLVSALAGWCMPDLVLYLFK